MEVFDNATFQLIHMPMPDGAEHATHLRTLRFFELLDSGEWRFGLQWDSMGDECPTPGTCEFQAINGGARYFRGAKGDYRVTSAHEKTRLGWLAPDGLPSLIQW